MTTAPNLTLYSIETELMQLILFRDSVLEDAEMTPAEQRDSIGAIDQKIQEYVTAEVRKCDGIAHYLREFETRAEALKAEAKRCSELAKAWEKRHDSLEHMVVDIMQQTKQTRIDGKHSVLQLKKNPPSTEVAQPELVPKEYQRTKVTLSVALWERIVNELMRRPETGPLSTEFFNCDSTAAEPMKDKIKEELKAGGSVPGCRLKTDGVRLEVK